MKRRRFFIAAMGGWFFSLFRRDKAAAETDSARDWEARIAEETREALEELPFPVIRVPGAEALDAWERLKLEGGSPVIIGGEDDLVRIADQVDLQLDDGTSPASILAAAEAYSFPGDYRARLKKENAEFEERFRNDADLRETIEEFSSNGLETGSGPRRSEWPVQPPEDLGLTVTNEFLDLGSDYTVRTYEDVFIAVLPTSDWTEAFAYIGYGAWNACPLPHEHVAAFRYWSAKYDLVLIGMSNDVLNMRAGKTPATREEALTLAREIYDFCPDVVDQGESLDVLAAGLMAGNWWYFWWD